MEDGRETSRKRRTGSHLPENWHREEADWRQNPVRDESWFWDRADAYSVGLLAGRERTKLDNVNKRM
jgi:hypothetical protein